MWYSLLLRLDAREFRLHMPCARRLFSCLLPRSSTINSKPTHTFPLTLVNPRSRQRRSGIAAACGHATLLDLPLPRSALPSTPLNAGIRWPARTDAGCTVGTLCLVPATYCLAAMLLPDRNDCGLLQIAQSSAALAHSYGLVLTGLSAHARHLTRRIFQLHMPSAQ